MRWILLLCCCAWLVSCSDKDTETPVTELPFFFIGTINGQTLAIGQGSPSASTSAQEPFSETNAVTADSIFAFEGLRVLNQSGTGANSATIAIMRLFDHDPSAAERRTIIDTGSYRYAFSDSAQPSGAVVRFTDGNGMQWTSEMHPQSDTSFRVEVISPAEESPLYNFQANFSCKLYNAGGDSVLLSNGSVRGQIPRP